MPEMRILKLGTLDDMDELAKRVPEAEIYCKDRVEWCPQFREAVQKEGAS